VDKVGTPGTNTVKLPAVAVVHRNFMYCCYCYYNY